MKKLSLLGAAVALCSTGAHALTITPTNSGEVLADTILGSGITIDVSSISYNGVDNQAATFTGGLGSGIGIDSGIILTTGDATEAPGPNSEDGAGDFTGTGGDADLQALVGGDINDVNILEFDFVSSGGDLFFNYVFASEEYNEYINSNFNDVFAFFLDGINIATIGDDFVAIDTVNCGGNGASTGVNCNRFNDNDPDSAPGAFNIEYDGFTDVLTASATGLSAGSHHIKLAIGDRGDTSLDSAVFIQGGSFSNQPEEPVSVPEPGPLALLGLGLVGMGLSRRRSA